MPYEVAVLTPEKVAVAYRVASIGSRIGAKLIDLLVIGGMLYLLAQISAILAAFDLTRALGLSFVIVLLSFAPFLYFILLEGLWNGLTLGKFALRIRVRMTDGTPVTFASAFFRNILLIGDFLPSFFAGGIIVMFLNERCQRLGDLASNTMVTHEKPPMLRPEVAPYRAGIHPFEEHIGHLRGMTMDEYVALKRLCDRFPMLPPVLQNRFVAEIWEPFQEKRGISPIPGVHPIYLMEAVIMRFGREQGLL
ncbi:MAG: RDD family protein [Armatimonadetes bacterium]|nr:RDD family protein [Armatimonadota bacterium]